MTGKLHHILAGIAVGRTEKQSHALVEHFPALHEMAEQGCVALGVPHRFGRTGRTEHLFRHGIALPAGQAHHRDASGTRGGGNGCNGRSLHSCSFPPEALAAGAMGCWGPPGGQGCRENALSDFTAYFTTFFRKKIHPPMGFSTSSEILVEKRRRIILILWYRKVCGPPGAAFSREGPLSGGTLSGSLCSPAPPRGELLCIYWSAVIDLPLSGEVARRKP